MSTTAQPADAPRAFGKYRLHRRLAAGGMGEVFLATLEGAFGFEKRLVVKTILPRFAENERFVEMFAAEAMTAVALSHGNIVPIYELGRHDDTFYIAMGYVDGPPLADLLRRHRDVGSRLPLEAALFITREILTGMAYAHTAEPGRPAVVHRDLSPRNVLIDRSGQVRIVDFGIAMPADMQVDARMGSVGYTAPEQARAAAVDPRADVFSVGCLLYEMLTGSKAFPREGVWVSPDLTPVPEELRPLLGAALALDAPDRPPDAGAFLDALLPVASELGGTYNDRALARHVEELLPRSGGSLAALPVVESTATTPVTGATQTFATRLTAIVNEGDAEPAPAPAARPEDPPLTTPSQGASSRRLAPLAVGLALLLSGAAVFIATREDSVSNEAPETFRANAGRTAPAAIESGATEPPDPAAGESGTARTPTAPATITLHVDPSHAEVELGGARYDTGAPYELPVPTTAAMHGRVFAPGYEPQRLIVRPGDDTPLEFTLRKEPTRPGRLTVVAPALPWAEVFVDGVKQKNTPLRELELSPGRHRVRVHCHRDVCDPARDVYKGRVTIEPGKTKTLTVP